MQKFFVITVFILLSAIAVAAQTAEEGRTIKDGAQAEFAKRTDADKVKSAQPSAPILSAKTSSKRAQSGQVVDSRVLRLGPTTTYLKNGLTVEEVVQVLGKPVNVSERVEDGRLLSTYTFTRSAGGLLVAEFENGLLVLSRTERPPLLNN